MLLVSPAEPDRVKRAIPDDVQWQTSTLCEKYGVDFLWLGKGGWCGVQRKELKDLLASAEDGRLARELQQVVSLHIAAVVVEGGATFDLEGNMLDNKFGRAWTREQIWGLLWSAQQRGVWVAWQPSIMLTINYVVSFMRWTVKAKHHTALKRPGPVSMWGGKPDDREFACHLLQGIPGVGPEIAMRVFDHFGRVPWRWDVDEAELMKVDGVGPKIAKRMMRALRGKDDTA